MKYLQIRTLSVLLYRTSYCSTLEIESWGQVTSKGFTPAILAPEYFDIDKKAMIFPCFSLPFSSGPAIDPRFWHILSRRASCQLLAKEWALSTGKLSPGGLSRNSVVKKQTSAVTLDVKQEIKQTNTLRKPLRIDSVISVHLY